MVKRFGWILKIYKLEFHPLALREWEKLDGSIKSQFKKSLEKRVVNPYVETARLYSDLGGFYKIKLKTSGFRLVYEVIEGRLVIIVIAVGKRDKEIAHIKALQRKG